MKFLGLCVAHPVELEVMWLAETLLLLAMAIVLGTNVFICLRHKLSKRQERSKEWRVRKILNTHVPEQSKELERIPDEQDVRPRRITHAMSRMQDYGYATQPTSSIIVPVPYSMGMSQFYPGASGMLPKIQGNDDQRDRGYIEGEVRSLQRPVRVDHYEEDQEEEAIYSVPFMGTRSRVESEKRKPRRS